MSTVYNMHHRNAPPDAVYVGRPSKFGNPFVVGKDGERGECVKKFALWVVNRPMLLEQIKDELRGKDLICWCKPRACHADILMEIANGK